MVVVSKVPEIGGVERGQNGVRRGPIGVLRKKCRKSGVSDGAETSIEEA